VEKRQKEMRKRIIKGGRRRISQQRGEQIEERCTSMRKPNRK
jgi:hypothetical protein